jgi:ribosomal protein S12 methylthiotransferase accessory factor
MGQSNGLPGLVIRRTPDGCSLVSSVAGRGYRVAAAPDIVRSAIEALIDAPAAEGLSDALSPVAVQLRPVLEADGHLRTTDADVHGLRFPAGAGGRRLARERFLLAVDQRLAPVARALVHGSRRGYRVRELDPEHWTSPATLVEESAAAGAGLVIMRADFDHPFLVGVDDAAAQAELPWLAFHLDGPTGWFGPAVEPGHTPTFDDLIGRRLAAHRSELAFMVELTRPVHGAPYIPPDPELFWMLGVLLSDLERWQDGHPMRSWWHEVELDSRRLDLRRHPVLPLPDRVIDAGDAPRFDPRALLDERTGIVVRLQHVRSRRVTSSLIRTVQSWVADMARLYPWANNVVNSGMSIGDDRTSEAIALGEGIERYCGNCVAEEDLRRSSYDALRRAGERAVDPASLVLYSPEQYAAPGFPFVSFTADLEIHWVRGRSLTRDEPIWVPASLVFVNWYTGRHEGDAPLHCAHYPGLAAGVDLDAALVNGIEEVIERDAMMVWWHSGRALPPVRLPATVAALFDEVPGDVAGRLFALDNEFGIPVMAAVVEDPRCPLRTMGFAARDTPLAAAVKAFLEAFGLQETARDLQKPDGVYWRLAAGTPAPQVVKSVRSDRRYLDDYRSDFRDVIDLWCQLQIHLDPRAYSREGPWSGAGPAVDITGLPALPARSVSDLRRAVEARGYEIVYVDVTTPDVALTGMRVVRVLIPGLAPNFPTAFLPLGKGRLLAATAAEGLNLFPMPYA